MSASFEEVVILGVTHSGSKFRPSDWPERLCGCLSVFGEDQRISYSPYVKPIMAQGVKCVVVNRVLEEIDPPAYEFLMGFARDNELRLREGRHAPREEEAFVPSAARPEAEERKSPQL